LPVDQREAFIFYVLVGMTVPEIAEVLQENKAFGADPNGERSGASYVVFGGAGGGE